MIRKYREEEPHNHHDTPGRQTKQSNQLSLPHQDDCKTRMDIKQRTTKHRTTTDSHNRSPVDFHNSETSRTHLFVKGNHKGS